MSDEDEELAQLSTEELRERATALAKRRWDVGFFWELIRSIPTAEVMADRPKAGEAGIAQASGLFNELLAARRGDSRLHEALRPIYIDYLSKHSKKKE
ncbi:hypothetical protein [Salinactinospora qingdaonensis]|uniref:Uncharacterized protein n=1 Tax=Salinactinospora qingdaonensis TaxID=702744 RepID=A0ABP7GJ30_9ACTN